MNWNQIRQALKGPRNWQTAPSEFVRALKELMSSPSNSRRIGTAATGQVELLEIRQVLSAANPTATLTLHASSVPADPDLAASSVGELQPHEHSLDAEQDRLNGQPTAANSDSPVVQPNGPSLDDWFQSYFNRRRH